MKDRDAASDEQGTPSLPSYQVYTCGPFLVKRWEGTSYQAVPVGAWGGSHYPRLLLKVLLCSPGRQASRGRLLDILWPDTDPEESSRYLNDAAYRLRAVLRPDKGTESLLLTAKDTSNYALVKQERLWVDADAALALLEQADEIERQERDALSLLEEAASLLSRGEFLAEEEHLSFYGRRARIARTRRGCLLSQGRAYMQRGWLRRGEALLSGILEENPLDEDALCALMLNLHQQGRTSEGLRLYEETRALLAREGLDPTETTRATEQHLRGEISSIGKPMSYIVTSPLPYPSLSPTTKALWTSSVSLIPSLLEKDQPLISSSLFSLGIKILAFVQQQEVGSFHEFIQSIEWALESSKEALQEIYSRRQVIALLIGLSTGLLNHTQTTDDWMAEDVITLCTAGIAACWNLFWEGGFAEVARALPTYFSQLAPFAQPGGPFQQRAASLLAQAHQIASLLVLEREDFGTALAHCQQALTYGAIIGDPDLQVAALIRQANIYFYRKRPLHILQTYQQAMSYLNRVSPLLRGRIYSGLSSAQAQLDQKQEALRSAGLAHEVFPARPEDDPAFLYTNTTRYILYFNDATTYLHFGQHQKASEALRQAATFVPNEVTPRGMELQNHRVIISTASGDLEQSTTYFERLVEAGNTLESPLHQNEARGIYDQMCAKWSQERRVKQLEAFLKH